MMKIIMRICIVFVFSLFVVGCGGSKDSNDSANLPEVDIHATDADANEEGTNTGEFTLTRTGDTTESLDVTVSISGTATSGSDYTAIDTIITIPAGSLTSVITVTPTEDSDFEGEETVILGLEIGTGYTVGSSSSATVTISDNDLPEVTISVTDADANEEGSDTGEFTITRTGNTAQPLDVTVLISGTAHAENDYTAISTTVTIVSGSAMGTVTVIPVDDNIFEGEETVILSIESGTGYTIGSSSSATVIIADNEPPVAFNLTIPIDGKNWADKQATFTWEDSTGADTYRLVIADNASFTNPVLDESGLSGSTYTIVSDILSDGIMYYWRVISSNTYGDTAANNDFVFTAGLFPNSGQTLGSAKTFSVVLGDVDADGDLDIVSGNFSQASTIWLNNGNGTFTDSGDPLGSSLTYSIALGDIDSDGDLDIVIGNYGQANKVWLNNGSGTLTDSGQALGSLHTWSVALGDIDSDGDLDIVVGNYNGETSKVWTNNGSGTFTDSGQDLSSSDTREVVLGDIDSDGDLDIVAGNYNQANTVWLNNGSGTFTDSSQTLGSSKTYSVKLGDIDTDGDLDIVAGNYNGQENKIWLNNGSGTFTDSGQTLGVSDTTSVALGDIDTDGDLDIVAGNYDQEDVVYSNASASVNTIPESPLNLSATENSGVVTFTWNAATDIETPPNALTYNIRVGTTSGGDDICSAHANLSNGLRMIPAMGNAQQCLSFDLHLSAGQYYWSVQTIDAEFAGSSWASEKTIDVN